MYNGSIFLITEHTHLFWGIFLVKNDQIRFFNAYIFIYPMSQQLLKALSKNNNDWLWNVANVLKCCSF